MEDVEPEAVELGSTEAEVVVVGSTEAEVVEDEPPVVRTTF